MSQPWKSVEKGVFSGGHLGIKKGEVWNLKQP
jgi:hypothetical protein